MRASSPRVGMTGVCQNVTGNSCSGSNIWRPRISEISHHICQVISKLTLSPALQLWATKARIGKVLEDLLFGFFAAYRVTLVGCVPHIMVSCAPSQTPPCPCRTAFFGEYKCTGRGANSTGRVHWSKELTDAEAQPFLGVQFIDGPW